MKGVLSYFAMAFLLHLGWENAQAPLYADFVSFGDHFWACFWGTITGDMIFMATIYLTIAIALKDAAWTKHPASFRHPATWLLPLIVGTLLAVSYELWAIYAVDRWEYGGMPLIPVVKVGLTPVLQMIIVPIMTIAACSVVIRTRDCSHGTTGR